MRRVNEKENSGYGSKGIGLFINFFVCTPLPHDQMRTLSPCVKDAHTLAFPSEERRKRQDHGSGG